MLKLYKRGQTKSKVEFECSRTFSDGLGKRLRVPVRLLTNFFDVMQTENPFGMYVDCRLKEVCTVWWTEISDERRVRVRRVNKDD